MRAAHTIQVSPLRACELCSHSRDNEGDLYCHEPAVNGPTVGVPCTSARLPGGGCGPDAMRMHWPELEKPGPRFRPELWPMVALP